MTIVEKVHYFLTQAQRQLWRSQSVCQNCGSPKFVRVDTKAIVTALHECSRCKLLYRFPTDPTGHGDAFYQEQYSQGFTTNLPTDQELSRLLSTKFANHEKSYESLISLVKHLIPDGNATLFDYGCSWGYGSWQFRQASLSVRSFELSRPRARFARDRLGVSVQESFEAIEADRTLDSAFDVFFSNHVIEHVPRPRDVIALAERLLRPGGFFVSVTPNGSLGYREKNPTGWSASWGKVHPNLISDLFWAQEFHQRSHFIGSYPSSLEDLESWLEVGGEYRARQVDPELLCVAKF